MPPPDLLQAALARLHLPAYVRDAEDRLVYVNPAAEAFTGRTLGELRTRSCADVFGACGPGEGPIECRLQGRDGNWRPVRVSESPLPEGAGAVGVVEERSSAPAAGISPTAQDTLAAAVSGQRMAEAALEAQERFIDAIFDTIQDGISVLDADLTIRRVNRVMTEWYADRLPLEGRRCYVCYHQRIGPCFPCPSMRCMQTGQVEREIVPGPTGSPVAWIELFSLPVRDAGQGRVTRVVEFVRDITARVRDRERLDAMARREADVESARQIHGELQRVLASGRAAVPGTAAFDDVDRLLGRLGACLQGEAGSRG